MKRKKSDCGAVCRELKERPFAFHLALLDDPKRAVLASYLAAGYSNGGTRAARESSAARLHGTAQIKAALEHHRQIEAVRYRATKDRQVERLSARAEGANAAHYFEIAEDGTVKVKGWDGIDPELLRGIGSVEIDPETGKVKKITVRDDVAAEKALAELLGHNKPKDINITGAEALAKALGVDPGELPDP